MLKIKILVITILMTNSIFVNAKTFKIASSAPNGSFWMKQMKAGAAEIKKRTENRVKFKFYPGGVMGSEEVVLKKIRIKQLHGAAVSNGVLERFYADSQVYGLPMLFKDYREVDGVRAVLDDEIIEGLEKAGVISFGFAEGGFAYAMSTKPINKTEDLANHKVWTPVNNKQVEMTLRSFGINPVPLNIGDVMTGLQTNIIDTVAVSPIAAIALQWHTQVKYMTDIPLSYIYATMIMSKEAFDKISKQDQTVVREVMSKVFKIIDRQNRQDNKDAFNALHNQGLELIQPEGQTVVSWLEKGEAARKSIEDKGELSKETLDKVKKIIQSLRNKEVTSITYN